MTETLTELDQFLTHYLIPLGWKLVGAIVLWIIGGWVINFIGNLSHRGMTRSKVEPTLIRYIEATLRIAMRIVLVIVILGVCGIGKRPASPPCWPLQALPSGLRGAACSPTSLRAPS